MAQWFDAIDAERRAFIERQHVFFIATAGDTLNLSPKGCKLLRVLGPNLVGYLDYPGSGNETANHLAADPRATIMFCSFEVPPAILRLYARGRSVAVEDPELAPYLPAFADDLHPFVRQAFLFEVERVQKSCGYAVPLMSFESDRETLDKYCLTKYEPRVVRNLRLSGGPLRQKAPLPA
jgi:hypothetical protein